MRVVVASKPKWLTWMVAAVAACVVLVVLYICLKSPVSPSDAPPAGVSRNNATEVIKKTELAVPVASPDFFIEYRLERDKVRSERSEVLREIMKSVQNDEMRRETQQKVLKMYQDKQQEVEMENLIKARGFADAIVFVRDQSVSVVVKANVLNKEEVIQVAEVIRRVSGTKLEDIAVSAKQ